jgi:hypothetical protein
MKIKKITIFDPIISTDDDYASLMGIRGNAFVYKFAYTIDTAKALAKNSMSVRISLTPVDEPKSQSIFSVNAITKKLEPLKLIKNIQQISAIKKDTKNANQNAVIKAQISDITTNISNGDPKAPVQKTTFKLASVKSMNQEANIEPILQKSSFVAQPINKTFKTLSVKTILKEKEDPGEILTNFSNDTVKGFQGLSQIKAMKPNTNKNKLVFKTISVQKAMTTKELNESIVVPIVSKGSDSLVTISKTIQLSSADLSDLGEFQVKFELINQNNLVIQKISKKVEHAQNVSILQTPSVAPSVSVIKIRIPGKNILEITQNDDNAKSVSVFRKEFKKTKRIEDANYVFVKNIPLEKVGNSTTIFEDLIGNASDIIYRIIPVGEQQQLGSAYTNVVAPAIPVGFQKRSERLVYAGVVAQIDPGGVRVEVLSVAPGVSAIKLLVKDKTTFESKFRIVPSATTKIKTVPVSDTNSSYIFLDKNVKEDHVYEYCVKLLFENGDEEIATGCDYIEYVPFSEGVVSTNLSQPRILQTNNGTDIQFVIKSQIEDTKISVLKKLLEAQGLLDLYKDELSNEKESLNNLVAHSIRRIDLTNGRSEYFKTFTGSVFSDAENRKISSVSPLKIGRTYRYVVSALLRSPETLFEKNKKTITNKVNIAVKYLPLKFKHPIVQKKGNIVTPESLKSNYSKDPMEFGIVGNYISKDVTLDISKPRISNAKIIIFNKNTNIVRWNVVGEKTLVDHFLIVVERMGVEEIVGKVHTLFKSNVIQFIDKVTFREPGSFRYKIIPVHKNYDRGSALFTDEVVI